MNVLEAQKYILFRYLVYGQVLNYHTQSSFEIECIFKIHLETLLIDFREWKMSLKNPFLSCFLIVTSEEFFCVLIAAQFARL